MWGRSFSINRDSIQFILLKIYPLTGKLNFSPPFSPRKYNVRWLDNIINFATLCKQQWRRQFSSTNFLTTIICVLNHRKISLLLVVVCIVWEQEKMKLCFGSIGRMNPENLPTNSNCFLMGSGKSRETRCCLLLHNALQ